MSCYVVAPESVAEIGRMLGEHWRDAAAGRRAALDLWDANVDSVRARYGRGQDDSLPGPGGSLDDARDLVSDLSVGQPTVKPAHTLGLLDTLDYQLEGEPRGRVEGLLTNARRAAIRRLPGYSQASVTRQTVQRSLLLMMGEG